MEAGGEMEDERMERWMNRKREWMAGKENKNSIIISDAIIGFIASGGGLISICAGIQECV